MGKSVGKSTGSKSRSRRAAASAVSMRWHRARVTAVRADGRVTESRHGTTADAVSHAVALAVQPQSNGRGRAYRECRVHGRVSTRLVGSELIVRRVSKRELSPIVDSIRSRAAARSSFSFAVVPAPVVPAAPCGLPPATTRARVVRSVPRAFESGDAAFRALVADWAARS